MKYYLHILLLVSISLTFSCTIQETIPSEETKTATSIQENPTIDLSWNAVISTEEGQAREAKWQEHWKRSRVPGTFSLSKSDLMNIMDNAAGFRAYLALEDETLKNLTVFNNQELPIMLILAKIDDEMTDDMNAPIYALKADGSLEVLSIEKAVGFTRNWRLFSGTSMELVEVFCGADGCGAGCNTGYSPSICGSNYGTRRTYTIPLGYAFSRLSLNEFLSEQGEASEISLSIGITSDNHFDMMILKTDESKKVQEDGYLDFSRPCPQGCGNDVGEMCLHAN